MHTYVLATLYEITILGTLRTRTPETGGCLGVAKVPEIRKRREKCVESSFFHDQAGAGLIETYEYVSLLSHRLLV